MGHSASPDYLSGFGSHHCTEALPGAVPTDQNAPRNPPYGLYPELLNGVPFTVKRAENLRTWFYRIVPTLPGGSWARYAHTGLATDFTEASPSPELQRWKPLPLPTEPTDWLDGLSTVAGCGSAASRSGMAIHQYACNADMGDRCFQNADGDLLFVPEHGGLRIRTEHGWLAVVPGEIALIPRGIHFTVHLESGTARGYLGELHQGHWTLPERGLIGSNGLADERHFLAPVASYEDVVYPAGYQVISKNGGQLFERRQERSPFNVVGWQGNYAPYKYDLSKFNALGSVSFDHPDPSILTVLTCPLDDHGRHLADFVVFPPRWDVAAGTFRPPFYHRNAATEVNGIVRDTPGDDDYYVPGMISLTPALAAHGVSRTSAEAAWNATDAEADAPRWLDSLWIQFESAMPLRVTRRWLASDRRDPNFRDRFDDLPARFDPDSP